MAARASGLVEEAKVAGLRMSFVRVSGPEERGRGAGVLLTYS